MHGRLKIKTTAEQEEEKRKERAVKQEKYLTGLNILFKKRKENVHDSESLLISAQLLMANPDVLSVWNYRREVLLAFKDKLDEEAWQKLLEDELKTNEYCLLKNPKSYGAWHHRDWVFDIFPKPPFHQELELCDKYLEKDERNFHCWDHRRLMVKQNQSDLRDELRSTQVLIEKNFSNYSAWHCRSKLLPCVYPPSSGPHPIPDEIFLQELNRIVTAVFTDPSDQSPWFFLRWLLAGDEGEKERLLWIALLPTEEGTDLVLVFTKEASCSDVIVSLDGEPMPNETLKPFDDRKCIWVMPLPVKDEVNITIRREFWKEPEMKCFSLRREHLPLLECCQKRPLDRQKYSINAKRTLDEITENFVMLDKLDHGNKWVLLSLVDILSMVDCTSKLNDVIGYLDHLEYVDPLRVNYYKDLRSKIMMEEKLKEWISQEYEGESRTINVSHQGLTRIVHPHYFSLAEYVDLSYNKLRNIGPLSSLFNCVNLSLARNPVKDLTPLQHLPRLKNLNLNSCGIKSIDILKPLRSLKVLMCLEMEDNIVSTEEDKDQLKAQIINLIPSLTNLFI